MDFLNWQFEINFHIDCIAEILIAPEIPEVRMVNNFL